MPPRMKVTMKRGREGDAAADETNAGAVNTDAKRPRVTKSEAPDAKVAEIEGGLKFTMRRGEDTAGSGLKVSFKRGELKHEGGGGDHDVSDDDLLDADDDDEPIRTSKSKPNPRSKSKSKATHKNQKPALSNKLAL